MESTIMDTATTSIIPDDITGKNDTTTTTNNDSLSLSLSSWITVTQQVAETFNIGERTTKFWNTNCRPDGRLLYEGRPIRIQRNVLTKPHAYGSSLIRINDSILIVAAVTIMVGQPTTSSAAATTTNKGSRSTSNQQSTSTNNGTTNTNTSTTGEGGCCCGDIIITISNASNSNDDITIIQSLLQRILNNNDNINLKQLIIRTNQIAYRLLINIQIFGTSNCINVLDGCLLASVIALYDTDIPTKDSIIIHDDGKIYLPDVTQVTTTDPTKDYYTKFQMPIIPIALSASMYHPSSLSKQSSSSSLSSSWIIDPSYDEYCTLQGKRTTIIVDAIAAAANNNNDDTSSNCILAIDSTDPIHMTDLALLMKLAIGRGKEIAQLLV